MNIGQKLQNEQIFMKSLCFVEVKSGSKKRFYPNFCRFPTKIWLNFEKMIRYKDFLPSRIGWISTFQPTVHSGLRRRFYGNRPKTGSKIGRTMGFWVLWRHFMIFDEKKSPSVKFDLYQAQNPKFLNFPKKGPNDF